MTDDLTRIYIEGIRVFDTLTLDLEPSARAPWLVLVGENGVGKSTVLQSLVLVLAEPEVSQPLIYNSRSGFLRSSANEARIEIDVGPRTYAVEIGFESGRERLRSIDKNEPRHPLFAYGCARGSAASGEDAPPSFSPKNRTITLFDDRARLASAKTWLVSLFADAQARGETSRAIYDTVRKTLCRLLPGVNRIEVDGEGPWFSGDLIGEHIPLGALSDGYITTVGWVIDLLARWVHLAKERGFPLKEGFNEHMQGLVLIDEIDLHLHPRWQRTIIEDVRTTFPKMSFVVTTHNPRTLLGARPGEIVVLFRTTDSDVGTIRAVQD